MPAQLSAFAQMVLSNPVIETIVERMPRLDVAGCYLAAGALFQTVWNCLDGRDPRTGIADYDLNYFEGGDLSWAAEDRVIRRARDLFADLDVEVDVDVDVEVRNEARVHLWYEARPGVACPPYQSTEAAISTFPNTSSCFGIRPGPDGLVVFAPFGFGDLFAMRTRPNPVLAPRAVYEAKTARWRTEWPRLTVLPWPSGEQESAVSAAGPRGDRGRSRSRPSAST